MGAISESFFLSCFAHTVYHSHPDSLARLHSPVWLAYSLWLAYTGTLARLCLWLAYLHSRLYSGPRYAFALSLAYTTGSPALSLVSYMGHNPTTLTLTRVF